MELNGINSNTYTASAYPASASQTQTAEVPTAVTEDAAAVYEKSDASSSPASTYNTSKPKVDQTTIDKLKADAEARYSQLKSLVEKLMSKQGETYKYATLSDLMKGVQSGEVSVDAETIAQAKKDVAEDGYWGVEQTADRIVSFAKALTGGDTSKVEDMRKAIEEGYKAAAKVWGDELPEISQKTHDRVNELLDEWAAEAAK